MKNRFLYLTALLLTSSSLFAQNDPTSDDWTTSGSNTTTTSKVGIGTTSPSVTLHVKGTGTETFIIEDGNATSQSDANPYMRFKGYNANMGIIGFASSTNDDFSFGNYFKGIV